MVKNSHVRIGAPTSALASMCISAVIRHLPTNDYCCFYLCSILIPFSMSTYTYQVKKNRGMCVILMIPARHPPAIVLPFRRLIVSFVNSVDQWHQETM